MKLVYKSGLEVKIGDLVDVNGEKFMVKGVRKPTSTGRVYLRNEMYDAEQEYFPGVIGAEWVEREDRTPQNSDLAVAFDVLVAELVKKFKA